MWDQHDAEPFGLDIDERKADPVDGNAPLGDHESGQVRWAAEPDVLPVAISKANVDGADGIDVPLDEVPAEPISRLQRALQVHAITALDGPEVGPSERFRPDLESELVAADVD